ncbi:MAG: Arm DNA-binding domain-containing protein [Pseudomonadota bacterium]
MSHGQYPAETLAQARKKRDEAHAMMAEDRDSAVQKKLDNVAAEILAHTTFELTSKERLDNMKDRDLAPTAVAKNTWLLMNLAEPLHKRPISEISPAEVLHLLQSIERSGRREPAVKPQRVERVQSIRASGQHHANDTDIEPPPAKP